MKTIQGRERLLNSFLFIIVLLFSLGIAEVTLRALTPFPINYSSNKLPDPDLGYRIATEFHEADAQGFRNPPETGHQIMAIGDSHTYGNNVSSANSWPAVFGRNNHFSTYNFGVGSYGIFAYHAVLKTRSKQDTRAAIIALYPRNDFEVSGSNCLILDKLSNFWEKEFQRLQLVRPAFQASNQCSDRLNVKSLSIGDWLERNTAVIGALDAALSHKGLREGEARYEFPDSVPPVSAARVNQSSESMAPSNDMLRVMLNNFQRMTDDWAAADLNVGVLILPSRERVVYGYFAQHNRLEELDPLFVQQMQNQLALEEKCAKILSAANVPYYFALGDVVTAFEKALRENREFYPLDGDGHPLQDGYAAYALAATRLLEHMEAAK